MDVRNESMIETVVGDYVFNSRYCLGQGSFGKVYKGRHKASGRTVAIKQIEKSMVTEQQFTTEISILKQLKHPNIVQYEDAVQDNDYFYIITEFCKDGDLQSLMNSSDSEEESGPPRAEKEKQMAEMFMQICEGFKYLQGFSIIHRDLKPANILIHEGVYKIADFGLARQQSIYRSFLNSELIGVPIYMSPQILSKSYYTEKCDVWSLGIIIYQMAFESLPWNSKDPDDLFFEIMSNPQPYTAKKASTFVMNLLQSTLRYLEKDRLSWTELSKLRTNPQKKVPEVVLMEEISVSPARFHKDLHPKEAEILNHMLCLLQSLEQEKEMTSLSSKQCVAGLQSTMKSYLLIGMGQKEAFMSSAYLFLKLADSNLHYQLMDYECMEDSRQLVMLLELLLDFIALWKMEGQGVPLEERLIKAFDKPEGNLNISPYAYAVIARLNALFQKPTFT